MIPWNPIHRYAGMTSLFDSLDEQQQPRDLPLARFGGSSATPHQDAYERMPLGFVDVREAATNGDSPVEPVSDEFAAGEPEPIPAAPHVELTAVTDLEPGMDDSALADPAVDNKVPFYKREISFGRKKDEFAVRASANGDEDSGPTLDVEVGGQPDPAQDEARSEVTAPFYKRELGFQRRADVAESVEFVAESPRELEGEFETEPVVAELEPFETDHLGVQSASTVDAETLVDEPMTVVGEQVEAPSEPDVHLEPVIEPEVMPEPVAAVPLHKRQISLGKNGKPSAEKKSRGGRRPGRRIVGLKIGASQLAAAVVQEGENGHELIELARTPLEPGIVLDGEVRDSEALVTALRSFFADQKLPTRDVRIGIASNRIGVRTFEIAGVEDEARFDNAVRFKAHEVLPIAASDSVLDYRVLEEKQFESGESARRILLVVAPRDQVAPYVEVADRAGLKLAGIDLEALGLLRAFVEPGVERTAGGTSTVVVSIGHEASTLLVSGGGACEFTRVFDWGGSTLQEAIAQELDVHPAEAATILRHLSLSGASRRIEGIDDDARNRALEAARLRLTPFARELVSSLQFYQTQPESLGIGEIVITGGTSQLDGLAEALHQMIGVQVRVGNPLQRLTVRPGIESGFEQSLGSLAVPIGLAIDDDPMRSVDLTPRDVVKKKGGRRANLTPVLIPVAAVIPLAALGFLFSQAHNKVSDRQTQLSSLQSTLATLPQPKGPKIDVALRGAQAARASAVAQVLGGRTSWDGMLRDLSRVLPENVWLSELKAAVSTPATSAAVVPPAAGTTATPAAPVAPVAPVAPTGVTLVGHTYSQPDVAVLLARLVALPSLANVQLQSAHIATIGKKSVVEFTILADLRGAGGGA